MKNLCALTALTLLIACSGPRTPPASAPTLDPATFQVTQARFGDADPVVWRGDHPDRYPVHGTDAARFQGDVDWPKARANGVNFAFLKATEGGDLLDPNFRVNWAGAARAGIPRGAYHFYYFCTAPEVQAQWFIDNVPKTPGDLPPVLDLEWNPFSPTCTLRPPAAEVRAQAQTFMRIIERHYGQRPIIYTTPDFWKVNEIWRIPAEYWLRSVAAPVAEIYPQARNWVFWQYSGTGRIPGKVGDADLNVFNGSADDFTAWMARRRLR